MFFLQILLLLQLLLPACIFLWIRQKQRYWPERGIPSHASSLFFLGRSEHIARYTQRIYQNFKQSGHRFVGIHLLFQSAALLVDLDLIKRVFITDFEHFTDRGFYTNTHDDPLSGNLVRLEGEPWKRLRTKLTPTFTSAKLRYMYGTLLQVAERFNEVVTELVTDPGQDTVLEIRDLCARFTTDIIGMVAYGIECDSLREPKTEFRLMGDKVFKSHNLLLETLSKKFPRLARTLHIRVYSREIIEFYTKIITQNVEYREQHQIRRNDFLDILIDLKNTMVDGAFSLTLQEIIGQSFIFFIAGFETSSYAMSFCLYELSQNPEIQKRARDDVLQCLQRHGNQLTYECLKDMKYLDQVLSETLRKYPVVPLINRVTGKDYPVPESKQLIEKGVNVIIPVYAIHHDAEFYPNPEIFDPERFTAAAVEARHPMAYIPFGAGQRFCIAERLGKMQTMLGIATLLRNFHFSNTAETPKVLDFNVKTLRLYSIAGGIPLKVTKIK